MLSLSNEVSKNLGNLINEVIVESVGQVFGSDARRQR